MPPEQPPQTPNSNEPIVILPEEFARIFPTLKRVERKAKPENKLPLLESLSPIFARYEYKNPETGQVESTEDITLDIEQAISAYEALYRKERGGRKLPLPPDFAAQMEDIWSRNREAIKQAIEEKGFDDLILIPEGLNLEELHQTMTADYSKTYEDSDFKAGGSFAGVTEARLGSRLVLIHRRNAKDPTDPNVRPEIKQTLNISAKEAKGKGEDLCLSEYLVYQRRYFEEEQQHLDPKGWTWCPGSTVPNPAGGVRFVNANWYPDDGQVVVDAVGPSFRHSLLAARSSRVFS